MDAERLSRDRLSQGPVTVVAEISCNHMGSVERARELIKRALVSGADAVKFQCYTPEEMCDQDTTPIPSGPWAGRTLWELYTEAQTPREWFPGLIAYCQEIGIPWFSSVFSPDGVQFLEGLDCPVYKIASQDVDDMNLWRAIRATGKPIIASDGCRSSLQGHRLPDIALRCVSEYPAPLSGYGLKHPPHHSAWGLSLHTQSAVPAMVAVAKGATMVEAHLMLDRTNPLDEAHSLTSRQFCELVRAIRETEQVLGNGDPRPLNTSIRRKVNKGRMVRMLT